MVSRKITFCPRCKAPLDANAFFSSGGLSDWRAESIGVTVNCPKCNYSGPPAEATPDEYRKLAGKGD
jgi:hypothetical protein